MEYTLTMQDFELQDRFMNFAFNVGLELQGLQVGPTVGPCALPLESFPLHTPLFPLHTPLRLFVELCSLT